MHALPLSDKRTALFFFETCCAGMVSELILKDVGGTFISHADSLCALRLLPKTLARAAS